MSLTRRQVLQVSAVTGVAMAIGVRPTAAMGAPPLIKKWVDPLAIPPVVTGSTIEMSMIRSTHTFHSALAPSATLAYRCDAGTLVAGARRVRRATWVPRSWPRPASRSPCAWSTPSRARAGTPSRSTARRSPTPRPRTSGRPAPPPTSTAATPVRRTTADPRTTSATSTPTSTTTPRTRPASGTTTTPSGSPGSTCTPGWPAATWSATRRRPGSTPARGTASPPATTRSR